MTVEELAVLAPDYPFPHPRESFLFAGGEALPLNGGLWSAEGRTAVVAYGSNRSPEVLRRKYGSSEGIVIPTIRARLTGFDVVYAAMVSTLGPVPATLCPSPGSTCEVAVQFFEPRELERMHRSERVGISYGFAQLPAEAIWVEGIEGCSPWFYFCLYGILSENGGPVALSEVTCENRQFPALPQREVQRLLRGRLSGPEDELRFLMDHIADDHVRMDRISRLTSDAIRYNPGPTEEL